MKKREIKQLPESSINRFKKTKTNAYQFQNNQNKKLK
jgi:hypothetical protein